MPAKNDSSRNVFTNRNFRLVFLGALVSELGAVLYSFAVSFYILEISQNNAFLQGLYLAVCGVVLLLLTPVGGVLGDRFNKAKIMYLCDYLKGAMILLATVLMLVFRSADAHIVILFLIGIMANAVSGIFNPASAALLPYIVEEEKLQQANSYFSVKNALEGILGIVLAGVMYAALPVSFLFLIVGICYLLSGVSEMFIRYAHVSPSNSLTVRVALADMKEGLDYLRSRKPILAMMSAIIFINFFFTPVGANFIPYFIKTDVALSPSYLFDRYLSPELWSSAFSVLMGVSSLIGSVLLSTRQQDEKVGHKTAVRLCAVSAVMISLTLSYWLLVSRGVSLNAFLIFFSLGCFLCGFLIVIINIPITTALMRIVDKDKLSKVSSIVNIASQGLVPISSVLAGAVLQTAGSSILLLICSAGFTATALYLLVNKSAKEI